jgi:hypothetical protein
MKHHNIIFGNKTNVPQAVRDWAESLKAKEGVYQTYYHGKPVYLIAAGERSTGGYRVSTEILSLDSATLSYRVVSPPPDEFVIQIITYPYELIFSQSPLRFIRIIGETQTEVQAMQTPALD